MSRPISHFDVLGVPIAATDLDEAAKLIIGWKDDPRGRAVGVRDVASLMAMRSDPALKQIANRTVMNLPDGMPLVWIGKRRGFEIARTAGADLMEKLIREGRKTGLKHYFYGGKEGVAEQLAETFRNRMPGVEIVGTYCPPFGQPDEAEESLIIEQIGRSGADVVWVGLSSPKQDVWMDNHLASLSVTMIGVGAAFDFHTGRVRRAPKWMQESGLEWLHRLASEPRRLWHRYLLLAPKFILLMLLQRIRHLTSFR